MVNKGQRDAIKEHEQSLNRLTAVVTALDKETEESIVELEERLDAIEPRPKVIFRADEQ